MFRMSLSTGNVDKMFKLYILHNMMQACLTSSAAQPLAPPPVEIAILKTWQCTRRGTAFQHVGALHLAHLCAAMHSVSHTHTGLLALSGKLFTHHLLNGSPEVLYLDIDFVP